MFNIKAFLGLTMYTSPLDKFLHKYDATHPKLSASQRKEIEKHKRVFDARDNEINDLAKEDLF